MLSKQKIIMSVMIGCLSLSLSACCCRVKGLLTPGPSIIGSWKLKDSPTTLTFRKNQKFQLDIGGDGNVDIERNYDLIDNRIELTDSRLDSGIECLNSGFYVYRASTKELKLKLYADECVPRKNILVKDWETIRMIPEKALRKKETSKTKSS